MHLLIYLKTFLFSADYFSTTNDYNTCLYPTLVHCLYLNLLFETLYEPPGVLKPRLLTVIHGNAWRIANI